MQYIFISGNTPRLSSLEVRQILDDYEVLYDGPQELVVKTPEPLDEKEFIKKLGGTVKIGLWQGENWQKWLPNVINNFEFRTSKIKFGFSVYKLNNEVSDKQLKNLKFDLKKQGLAFKKELKQNNLKGDLIESRELALSSVIINKEQCIDIIALVDKDTVHYGYTVAYQDYKEFSKRDYGRPARDSKSGMLPPKVAKMMINCAQADKNEILLDPFCGSGTVLQEALSLGYKNVVGSDVSEKAVKDTKNNLEHLGFKNIDVQKLDANDLSSEFKPGEVGTVVAEVFLGSPNIKENEIAKAKKELSLMYEQIFLKMRSILKPRANLVIAFPAWRTGDQITHLEMESILDNLGYKKTHGNRIYGRENAKVLREIYFLSYDGTR